MAVRAGIIGFGYMGQYHMKKSRQADDIEVVAAYDISADRLAEARTEGLRTYDSLDAFLGDDTIRLVMICTPNNVHAALSIAALNSGKHVMCEKPVTMNAAELEQVLAAAQRNHRVFTTHQNRRWNPDYLTVKDVVSSGIIGRPTTVISRVYGQRGVCFGWRADPLAGGGMLYDWGIHLIDQYLRMFPDQRVTSVYARLQSILTPAVDDSFDLEMIFDSGVCARVQVGTFCLEPLPRWFVYGDRGTLRVDDFTGRSAAMARIRQEVSGFDSVFGKQLGPSRTMAPLKPEFIETLKPPVFTEDELAYHRNLAAACEGREDALVTHEDMRRAMRVVDLAFESTRQRQVIKASI